MRLRLVSNGTTVGTYICDENTGEKLDGVVSVRFEAAVGIDPELTIVVQIPQVDAIADVQNVGKMSVKCP